MSEFDNYLFTRVAELEARLELSNKRVWELEQLLKAAQQQLKDWQQRNQDDLK